MTTTNLPFVQEEMIRYGMSICLALGLTGNIFNCIIFTRPLYRRSPSSVYHLSLSICALFHLIWSISPQLHTLYYPDLQNQSVFYCKTRLFGTHVLGLYFRYILVCACVDRFFATRDDVGRRSLSSVKMAIVLIVITCIVCSLAAIHMPILMYIRNNICGMFDLYKFIFAFYEILTITILPPALMIIFSALTIRSLHQRHAIQIHAKIRDRHLLRMVIAEVVVNIVTSVPFSVNLIYGVATYYVVNKSTRRLQIESFMNFFTTFIIYMLVVSPFYLFILVSKPYRKEFINIITKGPNKCMKRRNRIMQTNTQNHAPAINGSVV
ncbi:unnamed protein product [Adineta steineri]|uniref:G-protein coupled receptors family 1 profile domain-containing protein n=1 Tax=Adineta steineri TaxID=433720 RepID=A0A813SGJ5_9BILA|nr:unnamed protein product [Adineta steineri]CAF0794816.1 unnamed protein product [Adineta steineri]